VLEIRLRMAGMFKCQQKINIGIVASGVSRGLINKG